MEVRGVVGVMVRVIVLETRFIMGGPKQIMRLVRTNRFDILFAAMQRHVNMASSTVVPTACGHVGESRVADGCCHGLVRRLKSRLVESHEIVVNHVGSREGYIWQEVLWGGYRYIRG